MAMNKFVSMKKKLRVIKTALFIREQNLFNEYATSARLVEWCHGRPGITIYEKRYTHDKSQNSMKIVTTVTKPKADPRQSVCFG